MPEPLNIDVAAATGRLDEITGGMPAPTPDATYVRDPVTGQFSPSNEPVAAPEGTPPAAADVVTPPATQDAPPEPTETVDFTSIPDDVLSPELLQMKRSMQADYTRKTQEVAPWRKLSTDLGVDSPDDFRDALAVYQRLQDPTQWPAIHGELTQYMTEAGMTPQQAANAAAEQLANFAPSDDGDDYGDGSDPAYSQLAQQMQAQAEQIAQLTQTISAERESQAQQAQYNAVAEGLTRMEQAIMQQNPTYKEADITAIYNLLQSDGNLFDAQQRYESMIGARLAEYIGKKTAAYETTPTPLPGGGVVAQTQMPAPSNLDDAHKAAMAHWNASQRDSA